jgi:hypothetical protein
MPRQTNSVCCLLDGLRGVIERMALPAEEMAARAMAWASADAAVRAAIVYGSLAQGTANEQSDLDLIVVAEPGQRDGLWDRRAQIGAILLGRQPSWSQEPVWQRPYRYQSWDENLAEADLTFDEEHAAPWAALAKGFRAIVDKAGVAAHSAVHDLDAADVARLHHAAPASQEPAELRRSLLATADLYSMALDRWSERTGRTRPRNPLAALVLARLSALTGRGLA